MNYFKLIFAGFLGAIFMFLLTPIINGDKPEGSVPATPTPTVTSPDFWQKIVSDQNLSTVAIQSFKDGKIIREGLPPWNRRTA